jgi:hypothetical protein
VGDKGGGGGSGEKWTNPCMHIWIIKEKWKKKDISDNTWSLTKITLYNGLLLGFRTL